MSMKKSLIIHIEIMLTLSIKYLFELLLLLRSFSIAVGGMHSTTQLERRISISFVDGERQEHCRCLLMKEEFDNINRPEHLFILFS